MLDLEFYKIKEGVTPLSAENLNNRFYAIVRRIHALELLRLDWDAAVSQVQNQGLARINDAVKPLVDGLKADMEEVISLGQAAQAEQAAAVAAKLADMDAKIAEVDSLLAGLGVSLDSVLEVSGQLTKEMVTVGGVQKVRLTVIVPAPPEVPLTDSAQLEYLLW